MNYKLFLSYGGEEQRGRVSKKQSIFFTDLPPSLKRKKPLLLPPHQLGSQLVLTVASNHTRTF